MPPHFLEVKVFKSEGLTMADQPQNLFETKDKTQVLLHEYNTLRTEILNRSSHIFQVVAVGSALLLWLFSRPMEAKVWIVVAASAVAVSLFSWTIHRDIGKAAGDCGS